MHSGGVATHPRGAIDVSRDSLIRVNSSTFVFSYAWELVYTSNEYRVRS